MCPLYLEFKESQFLKALQLGFFCFAVLGILFTSMGWGFKFPLIGILFLHAYYLKHKPDPAKIAGLSSQDHVRWKVWGKDNRVYQAHLKVKMLTSLLVWVEVRYLDVKNPRLSRSCVIFHDQIARVDFKAFRTICIHKHALSIDK